MSVMTPIVRADVSSPVDHPPIFFIASAAVVIIVTIAVTTALGVSASITKTRPVRFSFYLLTAVNCRTLITSTVAFAGIPAGISRFISAGIPTSIPASISRVISAIASASISAIVITRSK